MVTFINLQVAMETTRFIRPNRKGLYGANLWMHNTVMLRHVTQLYRLEVVGHVVFCYVSCFLQKLVVPLCALFTRKRLKLIMNHHCMSVKVTRCYWQVAFCWLTLHCLSAKMTSCHIFLQYSLKEGSCLAKISNKHSIMFFLLLIEQLSYFLFCSYYVSLYRMLIYSYAVLEKLNSLHDACPTVIG